MSQHSEIMRLARGPLLHGGLPQRGSLGFVRHASWLPSREFFCWFVVRTSSLSTADAAREWLKLLLEFKELFVVSGVALTAVGLVPKVGPLRAARVALRSRLFFTPNVESARHVDADALRELLRKAELLRTDYVVVVGPKGVGKTTLVDTVLKRNWALVDVTVAAKKEKTDIVYSVSKAFVGFHWFGDPEPAARRVAWWLRLVGIKPTVVLRVAERRAGNAAADLAAGARAILQALECRVVIDASPNSLDPSVLSTGRELVLFMGEMRRDEVLADPVFTELFTRLQSVPGLDELVWRVIGGSPMQLRKFVIVPFSEPIADKVHAQRFADDVHALLVYFMNRAEETVRKTPTDYQLKLLPLFAYRAAVRYEELVHELKLSLPDSDKVIRMDGDTIKPASSTMAFVLRHQLYVYGNSSSTLSLDKLLALSRLPALPGAEAAVGSVGSSAQGVGSKGQGEGPSQDAKHL